MCGISGYIGINSDALDRVIHGLERLEYRGYDSAGVASVINGEFKTFKTIEEVVSLPEIINKEGEAFCNLAIGHTRWATHGEPSVVNAHPHVVNQFAIVHNGIIENFQELKTDLIAKGYEFKSTTDTEVACAYLDWAFSMTANIYQTIQMAINAFVGNYAIVLINKTMPNNLYAFSNNAPIVIGAGNDGYYIASDEAAFLDYTNQYFRLENMQIAEISLIDNGQGMVQPMINFYQFDVNSQQIVPTQLQLNISKKDPSSYDKQGFEHFMLKEISEQPMVIANTIQAYGYNQQPIFDLRDYEHINIIACGSSLYVGEIAKNLLQRLGKRVSVECASEFRYSDATLGDDDLCIFISQSGETADTLAALELVNQLGIDTLAVVNVVDSSIMNKAKFSIQTLAGSEIAVATTKAFSAQLMVFILMYLQNAQLDGSIDQNTYNLIINNLMNINMSMQNIINDPKIQEVAKSFTNTDSAFFLGRGMDYPLALEGSLKLKEISYIHSEAYPAGELKHGPIALINEKVPVICLVTDQKLVGKMVSNIQEVTARDGDVFVIGLQSLVADLFNDENTVLLPNIDEFSNIFNTLVTLQVLSYYIAKNRDCEIDRPKNLAKSVTVE